MNFFTHTHIRLRENMEFSLQICQANLSTHVFQISCLPSFNLYVSSFGGNFDLTASLIDWHKHMTRAQQYLSLWYSWAYNLLHEPSKPYYTYTYKPFLFGFNYTASHYSTILPPQDGGAGAVWSRLLRWFGLPHTLLYVSSICCCRASSLEAWLLPPCRKEYGSWDRSRSGIDTGRTGKFQEEDSYMRHETKEDDRNRRTDPRGAWEIQEEQDRNRRPDPRGAWEIQEEQDRNRRPDPRGAWEIQKERDRSRRPDPRGAWEIQEEQDRNRRPDPRGAWEIQEEQDRNRRPDPRGAWEIQEERDRSRSIDKIHHQNILDQESYQSFS